MDSPSPFAPAGETPLFRRADLWTGVLCIGLGLAILWLGADYPLGTGGRIGPGYVPRLFGLLLGALGLFLAVRSVWVAEPVDQTLRPRPVLLVLASVLGFAVVFQRFGLVPAVVASVLIANWAAVENTWRSAIALSAVLSLFAWALFVAALRLPLPVFTY